MLRVGDQVQSCANSEKCASSRVALKNVKIHFRFGKLIQQ